MPQDLGGARSQLRVCSEHRSDEFAAALGNLDVVVELVIATHVPFQNRLSVHVPEGVTLEESNHADFDTIKRRLRPC